MYEQCIVTVRYCSELFHHHRNSKEALVADISLFSSLAALATPLDYRSMIAAGFKSRGFILLCCLNRHVLNLVESSFYAV